MAEQTVPARAVEKAPATQETTRAQERYISPPVDIYETDEGLAVVADLPGVEKGDIDVHVENGILTIAGKVQGGTRGNILSREYQLLNYFRQFQLGEQLDQDKIKADYKSGVLSIQLPKAEKATPKKITVNVAS